MFRILSLDGGGIKGTFSAAVLASLEATTKCRCVDHFDLITGTSTGGIIAIGLALGIESKDIVEFYDKQGPIIFPSCSLVERTTGFLRQAFIGPKHSHQTLREKLQLVFGDRKFGEAKVRLAIPTYDAINGRIFVMKTAHHQRFIFEHSAPAVDVALATSAAPTYFEASPFPSHEGCSYVDGGVWANCPVMVGLLEAVCFLKVPLDEIYILSIGTTTTPFSIAEHVKSSGLRWNIGLVNLMFEGQMEAALSQAKLLIDKRLHRINTTVRAGEFSLDDASPEKIRQLIIRGRAEGTKLENGEVVSKFFLNNQKVTPFKPVI